MKIGVKKRVPQCVMEAIYRVLRCDMAGEEIRPRGTYWEVVRRLSTNRGQSSQDFWPTGSSWRGGTRRLGFWGFRSQKER